VAIHLTFQSPERTLTEDEASEIRDRIVAALTDRFGAELRA
jgi:phenylalanyl-tRNA synthetase beta chain